MRTKINALVVDDNKEFTSSIKEYFCSNAKIKIVSTYMKNIMKVRVF